MISTDVASWPVVSRCSDCGLSDSVCPLNDVSGDLWIDHGPMITEFRPHQRSHHASRHHHTVTHDTCARFTWRLHHTTINYYHYISAKYCKCVFYLLVCLSACISQKPHGKFHQISIVRIACGRGSVLLWRRCDTLCTSGFVDDVTHTKAPRPFFAEYYAEALQVCTIFCSICFILFYKCGPLQQLKLVRSIRIEIEITKGKQVQITTGDRDWDNVQVWRSAQVIFWKIKRRRRRQRRQIFIRWVHGWCNIAGWCGLVGAREMTVGRLI